MITALPNVAFTIIARAEFGGETFSSVTIIHTTFRSDISKSKSNVSNLTISAKYNVTFSVVIVRAA